MISLPFEHSTRELKTTFRAKNSYWCWKRYLSGRRRVLTTSKKVISRTRDLFLSCFSYTERHSGANFKFICLIQILLFLKSDMQYV